MWSNSLEKYVWPRDFMDTREEADGLDMLAVA